MHRTSRQHCRCASELFKMTISKYNDTTTTPLLHDSYMCIHAGNGKGVENHKGRCVVNFIKEKVATEGPKIYIELQSDHNMSHKFSKTYSTLTTLVMDVKISFTCITKEIYRKKNLSAYFLHIQNSMHLSARLKSLAWQHTCNKNFPPTHLIKTLKKGDAIYIMHNAKILPVKIYTKLVKN